jgi:hypothetical protein
MADHTEFCIDPATPEPFSVRRTAEAALDAIDPGRAAGTVCVKCTRATPGDDWTIVAHDGDYVDKVVIGSATVAPDGTVTVL